MLLQQKCQAESLAADLAEAAIDSRAGLDQKLSEANAALRLAESRAAGLREALDRTNAVATENAARLAAEGAVDVIVAAAIATAAERENTRSAVDEVVSTASIQIEEVERRSKQLADAALTERASAEATLRENMVASKAMQASSQESMMGAVQAEVDRLKGAVGRARAAEETARDEAMAAGNKISTLELAMEESEQDHALFRERAELRLASLRRQVEEEELEHGVQVCTFGGIITMPDARTATLFSRTILK